MSLQKHYGKVRERERRINFINKTEYYIGARFCNNQNASLFNTNRNLILLQIHLRMRFE